MKQNVILGIFVRCILVVGLLTVLKSNEVCAQQVTAYLSVDSVAVGQRVDLSLVIDRAASTHALLPEQTGGEVDSTTQNLLIGDLEVIGHKMRVERILTNRGLRRDSVVYQVTTFAIDTAFVPAISIPLVTGHDTTTLHSQPFFVPVKSVVPENAADIRALAPLATFHLLIWQWFLLAAVALMVGGMLFYFFRRRPKSDLPGPAARPKPTTSPFQEAIERLRKLERTDLASPATIKPYYVELSEVLRNYLERRLGLPALEQTTRELIDGLRRQVKRGRVTPSTPTEVCDVLELADFAKFADARPPAEKGRQALEQTRATLHIIETRREVEGASPEPGGDGSAEFSPAPILNTTGAGSQWRRSAPGWVAVGLAALFLGLYGGVVAIIPTAFAVACYMAARIWALPDRRPWLPSLALLAGLYAALLASYVLAPEQIRAPWLVSAEMLGVIAGMGWLMVHPGWRPAGFLGLIVGVRTIFDGMAWASMEASPGRALVVHILWRLLVLVALGIGARIYSRNTETTETLS